jgi:transcriptional antiterminator NusG
MHYLEGERWYALRVKSRYEEIVKKALSAIEVESLYLTYQEASKRKDRKKILTKAFFPGYMFIRVALNAEVHLEILKCIGVSTILHNSMGPIAILDDEIENIIHLKDYEGQVLHLDLGFSKGKKVRVIDGPLQGLLGTVAENRKGQVRVSIENIPGAVGVSIPEDYLELEE